MTFQKIFYKKTEDDWCPSYKIEYRGILKLVSIHYSQHPTGKIIISVFGADDMGMSIEPKTIAKADIIIEKILNIKSVNQKWLEELGFKMF